MIMRILCFIVAVIAECVFFYLNAQEKNTNTVQEMSMDTVKLRDVVVTASKPLTKIDGDGMVSTIEGTALSKLGSAKDVLGFIPGIINNNNGSITVFGKGTPIVYLNGRKLRNLAEIELLSSSKVKDVTLINNPGAKYGSNVNAVIKITTIKELGDGFSINTKTSIGYNDYLYGKESANMNYRSGGLDVTGMFEYNNTRTKGFNRYIQDSWLVNHEMTKLSMDSKVRSQVYNAQLGLNYIISPNHSLGVYYKMVGKLSKNTSCSESSYWINEQKEDYGFLTQKKDNDYYEHLIDGYYSGNIGKWSADLTIDVMWKRSNERQSVIEESETFETRYINNRDKSSGRMLAGEIHLNRPFLKGKVNLGAEYTDSRRDEDFLNTESLLPGVENTIKEDNIALYGEVAQQLGVFNLMFGLRYEYTNSNYYEFGKRKSEQSRKYKELLPSATVVIPLKQLVLQLGYSRKYNRPLYSQLSSSISYATRYLYETGNPFLKTPFVDNITMNMKYKWLMLMASYNHISNRIITSCETYDKDPSITLLKKENSTKSLNNLQVMASVMPGFIGKYYYPVLAIGAVSQFYETEYKGQTLKMNRPMMIARFNNIFYLPNNYLLATNVSYRSKGDSENTRLGKSWQIDLSATKVFDNHWDVKLSLTDIFNTAKTNSFTIYSDVRNVHLEKLVNTRKIELCVGYKFNVPAKSRYKGKGAGNAEKQRL